MSTHCSSPVCLADQLAGEYGNMTEVDADTRRDVMRWRRAERVRLIAARMALATAERRQAERLMLAALDETLGDLRGAVVGGYWPMRGEPDLRPWLTALAGAGVRTALPVVTRKAAPLEFHAWQPGDALTRGVWNIPVPARIVAVQPDVVVAPVVGFDPACYRLGHGGGYFDRTLAAIGDRVHPVGVGFELARLGSIFPLPHDVPLRCVITEVGVHTPA